MQGKIYKKIEFCQKNARQREGVFEIQKERLPPDRKKGEESLNFLALFDRRCMKDNQPKAAFSPETYDFFTRREEYDFLAFYVLWQAFVYLTVLFFLNALMIRITRSIPNVFTRRPKHELISMVIPDKNPPTRTMSISVIKRAFPI